VQGPGKPAGSGAGQQRLLPVRRASSPALAVPGLRASVADLGAPIDLVPELWHLSSGP
jgi:hypothetical protein